VPLPARVRFSPRVGPSQRSHATPKGLSVLAELAIRFSGPPFGAHYASSRHRRLSVLGCGMSLQGAYTLALKLCARRR